jgi:3-hydroxyacyl-[acyl-carrier-protein] dehydratase
MAKTRSPARTPDVCPGVAPLTTSAHPISDSPRSPRPHAVATTPSSKGPVAVEPQDDLGESRGVGRFLFPLPTLNRVALKHDKAEIERVIPHRGHMSLLDGIVWEADNYTQGVAMIQARHDAFWVPGHFPQRAMMPGVLMVEAGAQLACYLYNRRRPEPKVVAFLRIENAVFRAMVQPGDTMLLLCQEVKFANRRFISDIQGVIVAEAINTTASNSGQAPDLRSTEKVAFDARISGMRINSDGSE